MNNGPRRIASAWRRGCAAARWAAHHLPLVAGLDAVQPDREGPTQLLHGDFNAGNLRSAGGVSLEPDELRGLIDVRVTALQSWLDDLATAPIGIRRASPSWHETL
ncbi:MAG: phosphotransferase [Acidimicrobiia bacterium]|nr:phosphotransferase [Acidimicrobiia bacterium]